MLRQGYSHKFQVVFLSQRLLQGIPDGRAYGSLAEYQILGGDKRAGERSFSFAKQALEWMDRANRPSAAGIVYRDVSEAFMKVGDTDRAVAVFHEGRAAGGDSWLYTGAAAAAAAARQNPSFP